VTPRKCFADNTHLELDTQELNRLSARVGDEIKIAISVDDKTTSERRNRVD
jgi:hypothetical protein